MLYKVFGYFQLYIEVREKFHINSFVEQVKRYRMVYDLTLIGKEFAEKNAKNEKVHFFSFFVNFLRVLQLAPSQLSKGRSLDRKTLDYNIVY